jgi:dephospho-CoA kinase
MLIAIAGTLGAGKGTVAQYLAKKHNFIYLSIRNFYAGKVVEKGLAVTRDNVRKVAVDMKAEHGPLMALEQLLAQTVPSKKFVIESVRTVPEAQYLKQHGDALWFIDADQKVRYERTKARAGETGISSFEDFQNHDQSEMENDDANKPNLSALKAIATYVFDAGGTRDDLYKEVEKALISIGK